MIGSSKYGLDVTVCESHTIPGGCAHSFERDGYKFDSGPSIFSGFTGPVLNPLKQVGAAGAGWLWELEVWWLLLREGVLVRCAMPARVFVGLRSCSRVPIVANAMLRCL